MKKLFIVLSIVLSFAMAGNVMAWWDCGGGECDPIQPTNVHGDYSVDPSAASDYNVDGDSKKHGTMFYNFGGGGQAGGSSNVTIDAYEWQKGFTELDGEVEDIHGGGFIYDKKGNRIVGVISVQSVNSQISGFAMGGSQERDGWRCKDILPTINTDLTVFGMAVNDYEAFASFHTPGDLQGAFAYGRGHNEASYWGADNEENDRFLFWELPLGTNSLEGEATVFGGALVGTHRDGKITDMNNSVMSYGITAGTGMANVIEPALCWNSNPDNGEMNTSSGYGMVQGAAWTQNPVGSYGAGSYMSSYEYSGVSNGAIQAGQFGGIAGGYTNVEVGKGTVHVESGGFSFSTGNDVRQID